MRVAVVDASALAAVAFVEPEGVAVEARLANASLAAPALLWFELANVCLTKIRRHPDEEGRLLDALEDAPQLAIDIHPVDYVAAIALANSTPRGWGHANWCAGSLPWSRLLGSATAASKHGSPML
jgi:predicted nucleic acid-binding protein